MEEIKKKKIAADVYNGEKAEINRIRTERQMNTGRLLYDAICAFDTDKEAREEYYRIMDGEVAASGRVAGERKTQTVREQILRVYAMLFCDEMNLPMGAIAGPDEVEATADRLYIGTPGFDPEHWYRMKYHFPVIDEDNYDRFAALVISDLRSGPLHEAVRNNGDMLLVGELNPLLMTEEERKNQQLNTVDLEG